MKFIEQSFPFILTDVKQHEEIKPLILSQIKSMGVHGFIEEGQQLSNSDWYLPNNRVRPYFIYVQDIFAKLQNDIIEKFNYSPKTDGMTYWFQQYKKGDYHDWHAHFGCMFSNVYYVDLPEKASKTTFKVLDREFEVDVEEGQILTFPSCFLHTSKPNKSTKIKTVISVNF
jgi:hypothetical protein